MTDMTVVTHMDFKLETVVSRGSISASRERVWEKLRFYEHVTESPDWLVRLVLPAPLESEGHHMGVGGTSRCRYSDGGYLTKRITRVIEARRVDFEIIEQSIRFRRQVPLHGGSIILNDNDDGSTRITMVTRYRNLFRSKAMTDFAVRAVIKSLHKTTMRDMECAIARNAGLHCRASVDPSRA